MFGGLFPNALLNLHQGQNHTRLLSPRLWGRAIESALSPDGTGGGVFYGDDFRAFGIGTAVSSNVGYYVGEAGPYYSFEDTGNAIAQLATEHTGSLKISTDADTDSETWIQFGNATSTCAKITRTAGSEKLTVFETRFRATDLVGNRFMGLIEAGQAVENAITDAGAMVDKDFIGFYSLEATPTILNFGWKEEGSAQVTLITTALTMSAATWYKVGFVYDPKAPPSKKIKVYVDNVESSTYGTDAQMAASTFPNGVAMSPMFGVKNVTDIMIHEIDWWALYSGD